MSQSFAVDCYRGDIGAIAESVYQTMLGIRLASRREPDESWTAGLTAAVYYAGTWSGALLMECSSAQAINWTAALMAMEPPISLDDARDGLGELTNILAGNLKPLLPPGVGLSIPSVVLGKDHSLRLVGRCLAERLWMADETGPFRITLVETAG